MIQQILGSQRCSNGGGRILHIQNFVIFSLYSNVVRTINFINLRWAGCVARIEEDILNYIVDFLVSFIIMNKIGLGS